VTRPGAVALGTVGRLSAFLPSWVWECCRKGEGLGGGVERGRGASPCVEGGWRGGG